MLRSFRDPDGFVIRSGGRVLRCVLPHALEEFQCFLASSLALHLAGSCRIAATSVAEHGSDELLSSAGYSVPAGSALFEHPPVAFPNYPYEWSPAMLEAAAELTIELALSALDEGFALKDATPYNIMFEGPKPVFLDVLSFARRDPLDVIWRPYAQFVQTFVYPLLANRYFAIRLDESLPSNRDGIEPERLLRMCPLWRRWLPPFLQAVTLPVLLSGDRGSGTYRPRRARDAAEARFLAGRLLHRAQRLARRAGHCSSEQPHSVWAGYMESGHRYSAEQMAAKERFVARSFARFGPRSVLDIGANTGHFSLCAARAGARVVSIDRSPEAVDELWRNATATGADILPLVIDIARPTGALGWLNSEHLAFLDRARGRFDCVLMLALIHHLVVNERVPLSAIFDLGADLTTRLLIIEYVDPEDVQFKRIARGRDALHRGLTQQSFESAANLRFEILDSSPVTPTRRIYTLERK
jgi:hypothetical protein